MPYNILLVDDDATSARIPRGIRRVSFVERKPGRGARSSRQADEIDLVILDVRSRYARHTSAHGGETPRADLPVVILRDQLEGLAI